MASKDLVFRFLGVDGGAGHEFDRMAGKSASLEHAVGKLALGFAATGVAIGAASVEMADKFEIGHAKLEAAIKATGSSIDVWKGQIKAADSRMEKLGYTNAQTEGALGNLVIALKDPAKAMQVLGTAADLARAKNIDLGTAGTAVARAMEGNSRALKQMGIDLPINTKSAEGLKVAQANLRIATEAYNIQLDRVHGKHKVTAADLATLKVAHDRLAFSQSQVNQAQHAGTLVLDALNKRLGGQSQQYAQTFAGKVAILKTEFEDMGVKLGLALIPTLTKVADVIEKDVIPKLDAFGGWVSRNKRPIEDIAKVLASIAAFRFASNALSDVSRLLGVGSRGLGGAGGGILGSAKPIPVYVTNMGPGGFVGAGGKGVGAAERAGEGAATEGIVARVAAKVGLQGVSRLAGPLYATYLATQGGDQAPGQGKLFASGFKGSLTSEAGKNSALVAKVLEAMLGDAGTRKYMSNNGSYKTLNLHGAANDVLAGGNKTQIAALRQLGALYPALAKEIKAYDAAVSRSTDSIDRARSSLAVFRANLLNQRAAVHDTIVSLRTIPGAMQQVAAEAKTAGLTIGQALDSGVTIGIKQGSGQIAIVSTQVIDGVRHSMMTRARAASPSKMTKEIGLMLTDGLTLGLRAGKKGVGQAASDLINTVRGNIIGAGSLGNVASFGAGVDTLGASGGGGTSMKDILAFTRAQVVQDKSFARNLAIARQKGLSRYEAQQIAQLGPDQGAPLAASIAGASRSQIRRLNADEASIGRLGSQIGGEVSLSDSSIAKLTRAVAHISVNLTEIDKRNGKRVLLAG